MTVAATHGDRGDRRVVIAAAVVFALLSAACAAWSDGFVTADALTHYQYARYAFHRPTYLVDVWGRPLVTALYAVPAAVGGRLAVRLTCLMLALACALIAERIARGQGVRRSSLALVFTLAQPLVFLNSFAEMTELPFAVIAGGAFLAYQSRRWGLAALIASLAPLARPEGFGLLLVAAAGIAWQRRWWALLLLPLPLLLWDLAGWELYGRHGPWWRWLIDHWPYSRESNYPRGTLLRFVAALPVVVSPFVLPATLVGAWRSVQRARPDGQTAHEGLCMVLTAAVPIGVLAVHGLLYQLGKMGSYGEPRYLLTAAPFWAVLSARGWEWAFDRLGWRHAVPWAGAAALAPALALLLHPVLPVRPPDHWAAARAFADDYAQRLAPDGYPRVLAAHPAVFNYLDIDPQNERRTAEWHRGVIADPPPGTVLLWDPIYSARNAHADRAIALEEVRRAGWVPVPNLDEKLAAAAAVKSGRPTPDPAAVLSGDEGWHAFKSPRRAGE